MRTKIISKHATVKWLTYSACLKHCEVHFIVRFGAL